MAGNNNKKFFFREPGLDPSVDKVENLPKQIAEWLDPAMFQASGSASTGGSVQSIDLDSAWAGTGFPGASDINRGPADPTIRDYVPDVPGLTAKQPQVMGIVDQQVVQDPQGTSTVTATFSIGPEQDSMEYELRLTK